MESKNKKSLVVTLGDPYSCNVELFCRSLMESALNKSVRILVLGCVQVWDHQTQALKFDLPIERLNSVKDLPNENGMYFLPVGSRSSGDVKTWSAEESGRVALESLELAVSCVTHLLEAGCDVSLLTGPIDKNSIQEAGFRSPGHTEFLAEAFDVETLMVLAGPRLRVGLVTNHLALRDVSSSITQELIERKAKQFAGFLKNQLKIKNPRLAITGVNPHCSDGGIFGDEESRIIHPAVKNLQTVPSARFLGPVPADTAFHHAYQGELDGVLAMYHDQALGPLKTVHFDEAVNITVGLPFLRVSPDHGPVKDLFMTGKASHQSWFQSLRTVAENFGVNT